VLYSVELWGVTKAALVPAQKLLMDAVRIATGVAKGAVSAEVLLTEMGLRSIECEARSRIVRLWRDSQCKPTWVGKVCRAKRQATRDTWTAACRRIVEKVLETEGTKKEASCRENAQALWDAERAKCVKSVSWKAYSERDLEITRVSSTRFVWSPIFGKGLMLVMKARIGALDLCDSRAKRKQVKSFCWSCEDETLKENIVHLMLRCKCWRQDRYELLGPIITSTREILINENRIANAPNVCTLLLGGAVDGVRIENWMWDKSSQMTVAEEGCESMAAIVGAGRSIWRAQPVALTVAAYLQTVIRKRRQLLWGKVEWLTATLGKNPLVK
jgi:hypothetical protein